MIVFWLSIISSHAVSSDVNTLIEDAANEIGVQDSNEPYEEPSPPAEVAIEIRSISGEIAFSDNVPFGITWRQLKANIREQRDEHGRMNFAGKTLRLIIDHAVPNDDAKIEQDYNNITLMIVRPQIIKIREVIFFPAVEEVPYENGRIDVEKLLEENAISSDNETQYEAFRKLKDALGVTGMMQIFIARGKLFKKKDLEKSLDEFAATDKDLFTSVAYQHHRFSILITFKRI